jgi:hypothetical protein
MHQAHLATKVSLLAIKVAIKATKLALVATCTVAQAMLIRKTLDIKVDQVTQVAASIRLCSKVAVNPLTKVATYLLTKVAASLLTKVVTHLLTKVAILTMKATQGQPGNPSYQGTGAPLYEGRDRTREELPIEYC